MRSPRTSSTTAHNEAIHAIATKLQGHHRHHASSPVSIGYHCLLLQARPDPGLSSNSSLPAACLVCLVTCLGVPENKCVFFVGRSSTCMALYIGNHVYHPRAVTHFHEHPPSTATLVTTRSTLSLHTPEKPLTYCNGCPPLSRISL